MDVNRSLFLALTASLAAAASAACTAPADPSTGSGSDDIVQEGGPACFPNAEETAMPYAEGTCFDIAEQMQEAEYRYMTTPTAEGPTPAEMSKCTPWSASHPAAEGAIAKPCSMFAFDFAFDRCQIYANQFKRESAEYALSCMRSIETLSHGGPIYDCGYEALDRSCGYHPTAESTCASVEDALAQKGIRWGAEERNECMTEVSGLRASARSQIEARAQKGPWYSLHSAIEGLEAFPSAEGPAAEGGGFDPGF